MASSGKYSYHQIGLVRGQFGDVPEDRWLDFIAKTGFDGWEEASWELDLGRCKDGAPAHAWNHLREAKARGLKIFTQGQALGDNPTDAAQKDDFYGNVFKNLPLAMDLNSPLQVSTVNSPERPKGIDWKMAAQCISEFSRSYAGIGEEFGVKLLPGFDPGFFFSKSFEVGESRRRGSSEVLGPVRPPRVGRRVVLVGEDPRDPSGRNSGRFTPQLRNKHQSIRLRGKNRLRHGSGTEGLGSPPEIILEPSLYTPAVPIEKAA